MKLCDIKKLIAFLVGLCVLLTPVLSNASMPLPVSSAQGQVHSQAHLVRQDHQADCNPAKSVNDRHPSSSKVSHGCCLIVGNFSVLHTSQFHFSQSHQSLPNF